MRKWRSAENSEVEYGFAHAAIAPATTSPCGNASLPRGAVLMVFCRIRLIEDHALPRRAHKHLGPMIFWSIAIAVTAIACAALFYAAAGRTVNATGPESADPNSHFRTLLAGIETDLASGKLDEEQANAARGELAREMLRLKNDATERPKAELGRGPVLAGLGAIAAISLGLYGFLGSPDMPALPLAERPEIAAQNISLADAILQIEARLAQAPDDLRGWT